MTVVDREGRARDVGSWHRDPQRRPLLERYTEIRLDTLPLASPVALALHSGTSVTEAVTAVLDLMPPGPARGILQALGPETAVVVPLPAEERTVGVLTLYQDPGRDVADDDLETLQQVAVHAGRAIERVHRQNQQAQLAEALQRSLLTDPPEIAHAAVVVRYVPAAEAARVGGDWYDAFLQRDGSAVVVIGDVVGHDTAAAAAMGQLRGLLRGIAHYSGAGPAEVLRGLDEAISDMHTDTLATAAVARFERADAERGLGRVCVGPTRGTRRPGPGARRERDRARGLFRRPHAGRRPHRAAVRVGDHPPVRGSRPPLQRRAGRAPGEHHRRGDRPTGRRTSERSRPGRSRPL